MRVLDLFAGLQGWSRPFRDRGHDVFAVDIDPRFDVDLHADVLDLRPSDLPWRPDVVLASPPCESFSVMAMGKSWTYDGNPKTEKAELGWALVWKTLGLMAALRPVVGVMENPRGRLRTLGILDHVPRETVTYCRYGLPYMKPTDLWGFPFPLGWRPRPMCHNGNGDHVPSPRGSRTGVQGVGNGGTGADAVARRAVVPHELALEICRHAEMAVFAVTGQLRLNEPVGVA